MGKRRSIIRQTLDRFDELMAIGESRHQAKLAAHATGNRAWSVSDGRIHAFRTRKTYQAVVLRLITLNAQQGRHFRYLAELDAQADDLVARYLTKRLAEGKSAWTLKMERSALRLFFGRRDLAAEVALPARRRDQITRSRQAAVRDRDFDSAHWQALLTFLDATGLRRSEAQRVHARDVSTTPGGELVVAVIGKGGKHRVVPILSQHAEAIRALVAQRRPEERLFPRIPSHLDVHAHRRAFAQSTYCQASDGRRLPPSDRRLTANDVDSGAARVTSQALGHNRTDVTTTHYLR